MHRYMNTVFGLPDRLYRSPEEIRCEMAKVRSGINKINEELNIRSLLLDMCVLDGEETPEQIVIALSEALSTAEEAIFELRELHSELEMLEEELREVRCELRI